MKGQQFLISITQIPEALAGMRAEIARFAREIAADEEPRVAKRLYEIADAFEVGARPGSTD